MNLSNVFPDFIPTWDHFYFHGGNTYCEVELEGISVARDDERFGLIRRFDQALFDSHNLIDKMELEFRSSPHDPNVCTCFNLHIASNGTPFNEERFIEHFREIWG